jgi:hypothetical protein
LKIFYITTKPTHPKTPKPQNPYFAECNFKNNDENDESRRGGLPAHL